MARMVGPHQLAFGNLFIITFKAFEVSLGEESVLYMRICLPGLLLIIVDYLIITIRLCYCFRATGLVDILLIDARE